MLASSSPNMPVVSFRWAPASADPGITNGRIPRVYGRAMSQMGVPYFRGAAVTPTGRAAVSTRVRIGGPARDVVDVILRILAVVQTRPRRPTCRNREPHVLRGRSGTGGF